MTAQLLPHQWDVPQIFRNRLGEKVGRQRVMAHDEHLLLVLHATPSPEQDQRVGRFFWRLPDGSWQASALGSGTAALSKHLNEYAERIEKLDRQEEAAGSAEQYFDVLEQLAPVHRAARNLHHVLQEARQQCPQDRNLINWRDRAYDLERTADLLYQAGSRGLEFTVARQAEEQTRASHRMAVSAHRLNLLAGFFFPIATLTAIFGTNLRHGWEQRYAPLPFLALVLLGLCAGAALTAFLLPTGQQQPQTRSDRYQPSIRSK